MVYVEAGYQTDEDTFLVADYMAQVGADIVEETNVLVALAPFIRGEGARASRLARPSRLTAIEENK